MAKLSVERALRHAKAHQRKGELEQARTLYSQILQTFPENIRAKQALAALQAPKPTANSTHHPPQEQVDALLALYNQGQLGAVAERSARLTQAFPESSIIWNIRGAANLGLGRLMKRWRDFAERAN